MITLGETQYQWFKQTLEQSDATFTFVFTHQMFGNGRSGVELADLYEWGGQNRRGVWEFDRTCPGWDMPIHQLMAEQHVTIFFHGHDHLFAYQELDGVIYQELPVPADPFYRADAEGALFLPDKVALNTALSTSEGLQSQEKNVALDDDPYFKYVLGMDYTFKNGWYVNAQFVHGFFHERDRDELSDYIVFRCEKDFLNAELTIAPLQMAIEIPDWDDIDANYGLVGIPEIIYPSADNIELILVVYILTGKGPNMFSAIKDQDTCYFKSSLWLLK